MLGRISPAHFPAVFGPDGTLPLDATVVRARLEALAAEIAAATGTAPGSPEEVAEGFLRIAVDNMANAIRKISVQRGHDVTGYTLQCYGGAGGQHATRVADALGMRRVLLHPLAGVLSAYGMGLAETRSLRERQFDKPLQDWDQASAVLDALAVEAEADLAAQGVALRAVERRAHLRYEGSHQALDLPFGPVAALQSAFEAVHRARFGFISPERPLLFEMLSAEAVSETAMQDAALPPPNPAAQGGLVTMWSAGWSAVPLHHRASLVPGTVLSGPAMIAEATGTVVVDAGWTARVDAMANLVLERTAPIRHPPAAGTGADPVLLEVFNNLFMSVADQMGATLANTAWSVNIKERLDFSCAIFDAQGDLVANAPHVPVHLGSMSHAVKVVMRQVAAQVRPGDAFMLNSPYNGGTHLPDITVITPVFPPEGGATPLLFVACRGHHADVGGLTPGSMPPFSRRIEEEGLLLRHVPLLRQGQFDAEGWRQRLAAGPHPVRNPDQLLADLQAQVAANRLGESELQRLLTRDGTGEVSAYLGHVLANAAEAVGDAIARLRDGDHSVELDNGSRIVVAVRIDRAARRARIDFSGTSPQLDGNFNAPLAITKAAVLYVFRCLVGRPIPLNAGCFEPIELIVPEGCLLHPLPAAAVVAGNVETSQAVTNALFGALGVMAAAQGTMTNLSFGDAQRQYYETICGGTGAGLGPDGRGFAGADAVQSHMTNSRLTDPEILEDRFPVRLERFAIRRGSGGAGRWRGGEGVVRRIRFLAPMTASILSGSRRVPPFGLAGGGDGAVGRNRLERADGRLEELGGCAQVSVQPGDLLEIATPGGGGYGVSL
jgi:5-oxoprolinase (ATP-hydrolysing)